MPRKPEEACSLSQGNIPALICQGQGKPWQHRSPDTCTTEAKASPSRGKDGAEGRGGVGGVWEKSEISSPSKISPEPEETERYLGGCGRGAGQAGASSGSRRRVGVGTRMGAGEAGGRGGEEEGERVHVCLPAGGHRRAPAPRGSSPRPRPPHSPLLLLLLGPGKRLGWIPEQPPLLLRAGWLMSQLTPALQPRLTALRSLRSPKVAANRPPTYKGFGGQRK